MAAVISQVNKGSIAEELGIKAGDALISINGQKINDILDYEFYADDDELLIKIAKKSGKTLNVEIEKDWDESLGLIFDDIVFDRMKICSNRCAFCFVDQLPPAMRSTLYIKDDDYRYSFLYGNFITLTNLKEKDWQKIERYNISPLYVSVHTTDPELRVKLMNNNQAKQIKNQIERLQRAGLQIHTQIVLCPGINDGQVLIRTIEDLVGYYPTVLSIGIVPVGLTAHRQDLPPLDAVTGEQARKIIELVDNYQAEFRQQSGLGFVYLADEFYVKAEKMVPDREYYDDYCQLENGIGLLRSLLDELEAIEVNLPDTVKDQEIYCLAGRSALPVVNVIAERFNRITGVKMKLLPAENRFFGGEVTVTGLITGQDIIDALQKDYAGKKVFLDRIMLKPDSELFLDDLNLAQVEQATGAKLMVTEGTVESLLKMIAE